MQVLFQEVGVGGLDPRHFQGMMMLLVLEKEDSLFLCSRPKHMDFGARNSCLWSSSSRESWVLPLQSESDPLLRRWLTACKTHVWFF